MNKIKFTSFRAKRFRSLMDVKIDISDQNPVVICGENNVGKTNLLRAMNLFFNHIFQDDLYSPKDDIPHHIYYGSRGGGANTELTGFFEDNGKKFSLTVKFSDSDTPKYTIKPNDSNDLRAEDILQKFQFLFIESHNIDLPKLISVVLEKDGLLPLDTKRSKQTKPLEKLREFIELSQVAIKDIEIDINKCFEMLTDFDGILNGKKIKINFAEFEKLRDVVKTMTSITLFDGNNNSIASKGSGAQRAVFISLMQFISSNSKKNVIWGVDEPEAFLQPKLQKKVYDLIKKINNHEKHPVILTTHSQNFIDLNSLSTTHLFIGNIKERTYKRKLGTTFFEIETSSKNYNIEHEKALAIKNHLGIQNNDGWEVLPYNIIVEGEEDKKYLQILFKILNLNSPNIVWSGGASKIAGYLQYYNNFALELKYQPVFICIFDNDKEGREQKQKINPAKIPNLNIEIKPLPRHDGKIENEKNEDWEMEDFLPPNIIIETINTILRKEHYRIINSKQIQNRSKQAHIGKQVLKYAEECVTQNNPTKAPLSIDNEGRKKQICMQLSKDIESGKIDIKSALTEDQIKFINELAKNEQTN